MVNVAKELKNKAIILVVVNKVIIALCVFLAKQVSYNFFLP